MTNEGESSPEYSSSRGVSIPADRSRGLRDRGSVGHDNLDLANKKHKLLTITPLYQKILGLNLMTIRVFFIIQGKPTMYT